MSPRSESLLLPRMLYSLVLALVVVVAGVLGPAEASMSAAGGTAAGWSIEGPVRVALVAATSGPSASASSTAYAYDDVDSFARVVGSEVCSGSASSFVATRGPGAGVQSLDPSDIRLSQASVNSPKVAQYTDDMAANGWRVDPVDVVRMPDGRLTTFDNKRVVAANNAGINVQAQVHAFDDAFPAGRLPGGKGDLPSTWGDAVTQRIGNQKPAWRNCYPMGGPFTCLTGQ